MTDKKTAPQTPQQSGVTESLRIFAQEELRRREAEGEPLRDNLVLMKNDAGAVTLGDIRALLRPQRVMHAAPAFDHIVNPPHDWNRGRCDLWMHLGVVGPAGAVSLTIMTHWHLPESREQLSIIGRQHDFGYPGPVVADMSVHSPTEKEGWKAKDGPCEFLGGPCWSSTCGALPGDRYLETLLRYGSEPFWLLLETAYEKEFEEGRSL